MFFLRFCFGLFLLHALVPSLAHTATLENPGNNQTYSGIGVISGWKCEATRITVVIDDGTPIPMLHGSERGDTRGACGDTNNGFLAIFNYALLDDGEHTAVAYDNEEEFARSTFEVGTLGEEFVRGARAEVRVEDFPSPGESTLLVWNEASQHFEVAPEPSSGFAPVDQAAFDRLVVGKQIAASGSADTIAFVSPGRFRETLANGEVAGSYTYTNTGPNTGRLTQNYEGSSVGDSAVCTSELTFTSATTGSLVWTCGSRTGRYTWRIIDSPSGAGSSGGGGSAAAGTCRAGLVVNPGESCTYQGHTFSVSASGRGSIAFFSAGGSIDARGSTINGVRWNFYASKNTGSNSWTIHTAD